MKSKIKKVLMFFMEVYKLILDILELQMKSKKKGLRYYLW